MAVFKGSAVAIVTPMKENGDINYDKLAELIDEQIEAGTDAIVICGTTGESSTLSHQEHLDAIRFCVKHTAGRVPVIAGTGSNSTKEAVYMSVEAEKSGADALLLVTPYYNKATQKGLIRHYTMIAESVSLPVIMYNVPSRTGCNIQPATAAYLVKHVKNIVGIKEASGNISQIAELMRLAGDEIELYSGNDDQVVPLLSLGGLGVISVLANVAPKYTHDMVMKFHQGDIKGSCEMQLNALPLINALFCEVNPIPVKAALNLMGKEVGDLRPPMYKMEEQNQERLRKAMEDFGIACK